MGPHKDNVQAVIARADGDVRAGMETAAENDTIYLGYPNWSMVFHCVYSKREDWISGSEGKELIISFFVLSLFEGNCRIILNGVVYCLCCLERRIGIYGGIKREKKI